MGTRSRRRFGFTIESVGRFGAGPTCVSCFSFPCCHLHNPSSLVRWNPKREDENFFNQSVALYVEYYYIQILIHRPFIPSPSKPRPLTFPSLAICTNAARSSIHILHIQRVRKKDPAPHTMVLVHFPWLLSIRCTNTFFFGVCPVIFLLGAHFHCGNRPSCGHMGCEMF
jgi:hypothetical protein